MYKTDYGIRSKFSFLLQVINNRANKMRNTCFKAKMALLAENGVSFCNIETGNNNVVWFFAIFYVYNMLTQVLDHNRDFYVEQEVFYKTFSLKNCVFVKGKITIIR